MTVFYSGGLGSGLRRPDVVARQRLWAVGVMQRFPRRTKAENELIENLKNTPARLVFKSLNVVISGM